MLSPTGFSGLVVQGILTAIFKQRGYCFRVSLLYCCDVTVDTGNSNVMTLQFDGWNRDKGDYLINLKALAEQPSQELDTKYSYTLLSERLTQIFVTGFQATSAGRWYLAILSEILHHRRNILLVDRKVYEVSHKLVLCNRTTIY